MITNSGRIITEKIKDKPSEEDLARMLEIAKFRELAYEKHRTESIAAGLAEDYKELGDAYYEEDRFDEAIPHFEKAAEYMRIVFDASLESQDGWALVVILSRLGWSYYCINIHEPALDSFKAESDTFERFKNELDADDLRGYSHTFKEQAIVYEDIEMHNEMFAALKRHVEIAAKCYETMPDERYLKLYSDALEYYIARLKKYSPIKGALEIKRCTRELERLKKA